MKSLCLYKKGKTIDQKKVDRLTECKTNATAQLK